MPEHPCVHDTGPIAAVPIDSSDPARDLRFWAALAGWVRVDSVGDASLHPSERGPLLELCQEPEAKRPAKNRLHLDVRLEPGEDPDAVVALAEELGGEELHPEWGELPRRVMADPSGNELCILPAHD